MGLSRCCSEPAAWGRWAGLACGLALLAVNVRGTEPDPTTGIAVVVGSTSPVRSVNVDELRELYLRRRRVWPDGSPAVPVNLPADNAMRIAFSRRVLGRSPVELESYWRGLYLEGLRPPLVLRTGQAVCAYVAVEASAIGYLRRDEIDPSACRVVFALSEGGN